MAKERVGMRNKYRMEESNGNYYFSQWVRTQIAREEWDVTSTNDMAKEGNFLCSLLLYDSERAKETIREELKNGAGFMVLSIDNEIIYKGKPDYDAWIKAVLAFYEGKKKEQEQEDSLYHLQPDFKERVLKYLEAARVLIADNSDMEEIMYQRDRYYGEEDEVALCIEGIKKVL